MDGEGSDKAELLSACYYNSLQLAADQGLKTIAFPAISTGIYGYPLNEAARVSSAAIQKVSRCEYCYSGSPSGFLQPFRR